MGTWSIKPFGNDAALDWFSELESCVDAGAFLARTLDSVCLNNDRTNWPSECAVAAAAIVAAAAFEPVQKLPKSAKDWITRHGFVPAAELVEQATAALERIAERSDLKELWEESGSGRSWMKDTQSIIERLKAAPQGKPPLRVPKKSGTPRQLCKLIERYAAEPDPTLRAKIRQRFETLEDIHSPSRETRFTYPLRLAAENGFSDEVRLLIEKGADPNQGDPFVGACINGHIRIAEFLLEHGAELYKELKIDPVTGVPLDKTEIAQGRAYTVYRFIPGLYVAARIGPPEAIDFLLKMGGDLHQRDLNGETLLHKACEQGNAATAKHLLSLGIDMNLGTQETHGRAIHCAVRARKLETTRVLLEAGADVNVLDSWHGKIDHWDISPLDIAEGGKQPQLIALLKEYGAKRGADIVKEKAQAAGSAN